MTASELGRRVKDASSREIEELAETVAGKELLEPLLRHLLWERRRVLLFLLFLPVSVAFLGTCASGWADNFFSDRPLTGTVVEVLVQKFSPGKFLIAATLLSVASIVQFHIVANFLTAHSRRPATLLATVARKLPSEEVGWVCAKLWIYRRAVALREWKPIEEAVATSLLHLEDAVAQKLSTEAIRWLHWRLAKTESPEFRVAALLTLAGTGDGKIVSVARGLQSDSDERVRAAASEALRVVKSK